MTQKQRLTNLLLENWLTSFQMQMYLKSSSADRVMRFIRENPPKGYEIKSRRKKIKGYPICNEYKLEKIENK